MTPNVTTVGELVGAHVDDLLARYGVALIPVNPDTGIPASYWGEREAGLAGRSLFARADTPAHSLLHELSHYVCMSPERRAALWRDAGGSVDEECAVCYLQILLADHLPGVSRAVLWTDMDAWGYSFREGSARRWFAGDGISARRWLIERGLISVQDAPTWRLRED